MMKVLALFVLVGCAAAQFQGRSDLNQFQGKFVWDLLKPALTSAEALTIENSRDANAYPTYNTIPDTKFDCSSKAGPGFYADTEAGCQVFHRCDLAGNVTDYLCVNSTIFNQITLICDKWYNVDCGRSIELENFANSRLYTDKPLFDSPPAGYIAPSQQIAGTVNVAHVSAARAPARSGSVHVTSAKGKAQSSGRSADSAAASDTSSSADSSSADAAPASSDASDAASSTR